jgi:coenzyme F420-reducing hydrogenase delta subunit
VEFTRDLLEQIGIQGQRLQMINVSSAMAGEFSFAAAEITAEIRRLGPNPLRSECASLTTAESSDPEKER